MHTLHLTLKRRWYDMIESGVKREEYREIKPYWNVRLGRRKYYAVCFRNGYAKDARRMTFKLRGVTLGFGKAEWGAPSAHAVYVLKLGKRMP